MNYEQHILVVDDDPLLLEQAENILSDKYRVSLANSGEQAVKYLERGESADIILLDILMPKMDGYETLQKIKQIEGCKDIPVIFLTSLMDSDSEIQGLSCGASDFITKPFNPKVLLARLDLRLKSSNLLDEEKMERLPVPLTETEWKVAKLLAKSYSNDEICQELHYALDTVKKLVSRILNKMDIKNRKEIKQFLKQ